MAKQANKQARQVVDFNKLRRKRQRATVIRRLLALVGVAAALAGIVLLNNLLVQESVTTRISDLFSGVGGAGYPAALPGGVIRDVKTVGDSLAVLNDTNLYIYNARGKQTGNFQKMTEKTVLLVGGDRLLTYDEGAKKYAIHSRSKTLHEQDTEYGLITAAMNERGDYAIVSSSKQSICEINVFNKRFAKTYQCYFASNVVSAVSLSPKGGGMAAGWVNAVDGVLYSGVDIYRLSSDEVEAALELEDNLILDVRYLEEDRIGVLTDRQYLVIGADGKIRHSYSFSGRAISAIEQEGRQALLLLENREAGVRDVVLLDADLKEKAVLATADKVLDMRLGARRIYLLGEDAIRIYNQKFEPDSEQPVSHVDRIELAGSRLYYFDREDIRVFGQAEAVPEEDFIEEEDFLDLWEDEEESQGEPSASAPPESEDTGQSEEGGDASPAAGQPEDSGASEAA